MHATEVVLTLERFSLLIRDKCFQNSIIESRLKFDKYYQTKVRDLSLDEDKANFNYYAGRIKTIFANSDAIFDAAFIDFLNSYADLKQNKDNLFVYEYLHENVFNMNSLNYQFRNYLREEMSLSTHFDGIDLAFGLPIAFKLNLNQPKSKSLNGIERPFDNFIYENTFNEQDIELSEIMMIYFTNFVKSG